MASPGGDTPPTLHQLQKKGHHVQGVNRYGEFSRTLLEAFDRAHFSLILVRYSNQELLQGGCKVVLMLLRSFCHQPCYSEAII